ncbi:MAG TPA: RidA family protein [bacterium]|nr:RidA family protein [bacterium]
MNRRIVTTENAPPAIGPYSQAVRSGQFLFVSGQIPMDPVSSTIVSGGIDRQARRVLDNLRAILEADGMNPENVVKVTIFLKDMAHFGIVNEIYAEMFSHQPPARECVEVSRLPRDVLVEISAIATL